MKKYIKVVKNDEVTSADLGNHNEKLLEISNLSFNKPQDVARILNPKDMPKPTGKVYKG